MFQDQLLNPKPQKTPPLVIRSGEQETYTRNLMAMIKKLEREWESGTACLQLTMLKEKVSSVVGKPVLRCYQRLIDLHHRRSSEFRQNNVDWLLELYKPLFAAPKKMLPARVETAVNKQGKSRIKALVVEVDGQPVTLSLDQALRASKWGLGFKLEDPSHEDWIATRLMRQTVEALASDLRSLQSIELITKLKRGDLRIIPGIKGYLFEEMMMDILNENGHSTRRASLLEDFFEKTDLRYKVEGLQRRKGARIQVTYTTKPDLLKQKLAQIKHRSEYIILSPLSLAEALSRDHKALAKRFDVGQVWDCVGKLATVKEVATALRKILLDALDRAPEHPMGPIAFVPEPVKHLIQFYVEREAFRTTHMLRIRERKQGQVRSIDAVKRKKQRKWLQAYKAS